MTNQNKPAKVAGYYESPGMRWEPGEVPICSYCDDVATIETPTSGVVLCDNQTCQLSYIADECERIEYVEGGRP